MFAGLDIDENEVYKIVSSYVRNKKNVIKSSSLPDFQQICLLNLIKKIKGYKEEKSKISTFIYLVCDSTLKTFLKNQKKFKEVEMSDDFDCPIPFKDEVEQIDEKYDGSNLMDQTFI